MPAWWVGLTKLGVALLSPVVHRQPVIDVIARAVGIAPSGRDQFARGALRCSFCGKHRDRVEKLIAGRGVYICNECIVSAVGELAKSR